MSLIKKNLEINSKTASEKFDVTREEALKMLSDDNVKVLDIRTLNEIKIVKPIEKDAIIIDYYADDYEARIAALDPTKTYIMHCKSGGRSDRSLPIMRANNIANVHHLEAGFDGWKAAGLPIFRP